MNDSTKKPKNENELLSAEIVKLKSDLSNSAQKLDFTETEIENNSFETEHMNYDNLWWGPWWDCAPCCRNERLLLLSNSL